MKRRILNINGQDGIREVGDGFQAWNDAIGADIGQIVPCLDGKHELWADEEGLCKGEPTINVMASAMAGQPIVGSVILFRVGDIK